MDPLEEKQITDYFNLSTKIAKAKKRYTYYDWLFWQQSFISSPCNMDENGNQLSYEPYARQVDDLVDYQSFSDMLVDLLEFKKHEFSKYLASLDSKTLDYLKTRYMLRKDIPEDTAIDTDTINEINQIEEACGHKYHILEDNAVDLSNDYKSNLNNILGALI